LDELPGYDPFDAVSDTRKSLAGLRRPGLLPLMGPPNISAGRLKLRESYMRIAADRIIAKKGAARRTGRTLSVA
jgi:hypothetical protein